MDFKLGTNYEEWIKKNCDKAKEIIEEEIENVDSSQTP